MNGYTKCPNCRKFLFEEDLKKRTSKKDDKLVESCRWCGEVLDTKALRWRGSYHQEAENEAP